MNVHIYQLDSNPVVMFAARELKKYLTIITGEEAEIHRPGRYTQGQPGVWVGMPWHFGKAQMLEIADRVAEFNGPEDAVRVLTRWENVMLTGANPRSVLFAAYRWLEALGCRWLYPGKAGERVPRIAEPLMVPVDVLEVPSTRYRVIGIEGSCSLRHVRDMIDYAAKRGFNGYFMQLFNGFTFFERWYRLERNRKQVEMLFTPKKAFQLTAKVKASATQRGMMLHAVCHGWTCRPLDLPAEQWEPYIQPVSPVVRPYLAETDGERRLFHGIPLLTHLCYSNPLVQMMFVEGVLQYIAEHPEEEIIHVWLAGGMNNYCECTECRKTRPSDLYIRMLNTLDAELTQLHMTARLAFTADTNVGWELGTERIHHPDRFILVFTSGVGPLPAHGHNKPADIAGLQGNLPPLDAWKGAFDGERITVGAYYGHMHHYDLGQMCMARIIWEHLRGLNAQGFTGFISTQSQRVCFPTGLSMHVMGKTLWNNDADFDTLVDEYLGDVFGEDGPAVRRYLETLTYLLGYELTNPCDNRTPADPDRREPVVKRLNAVPVTVDAFLPIIERGIQGTDHITAASWRILAHHAWYVKAFADLYSHIYRHDASAVAAYQSLVREIHRRLPQLHRVFDTYTCTRMYQHALTLEGLLEEQAPLIIGT